MRKRKNRKRAKKKQVFDYGFELDEEHQQPAIDALRRELKQT